MIIIIIYVNQKEEMIVLFNQDFISIDNYFYKCCILEFDTSYKTILPLFKDNSNNSRIFDDVYNLYLSIYLLPKLISPLTFSKLKITKSEFYIKYINYYLSKCFINRTIYKNNEIFISNALDFITNNNKK